MYLNDIYTIGANLAGLPGLSLPCGFVDGLPMGLQLIGPHFSEARLLNAAHHFQRATEWHTQTPARVRVMSDWEVVIGLEIHAQLATKSKIFSGSATAYGARPNTPGQPGRPGLSGRAAGAERGSGAHGGQVRARHRRGGRAPLGIRAQELLLSRFAEGLSDQPVRAAGGRQGAITIMLDDGAVKTIGITRAHLEEDAGKSLHEGLANASGIDLNRAGTPLLEIVSEPDMRSAKEAVAYMKKIHTLVRYLEICDGNMQEGSFRCDANVSVRPRGRGKVRHARRDQESELVSLRREGDSIRSRAPDRADRERRQGGAGDAAVRLGQGRDPLDALQGRGQRLSLLSRIRICCRWRSTRGFIDAVRATLPELPDEKAARFAREFGLSAYDAGVLSREPRAGRVTSRPWWRRSARRMPSSRPIGSWANYRARSIATTSRSRIRVSRPPRSRVCWRASWMTTISGKIAKEVFEAMWSDGKSADAIIEAQGLKQITDSSAIEGVIDAVIAANPKQLADYRSGKDKLFGFFVGQVDEGDRRQGESGAAQRIAEDQAGGRVTGGGFLQMHDRDCLHRFMFEHYPIRGHLVHLDAAWRALIEHRDYPERDPRYLGRSGGGLAAAGRDHQIRRRSVPATAGRRARASHAGAMHQRPRRARARALSGGDRRSASPTRRSEHRRRRSDRRRAISP